MTEHIACKNCGKTERRADTNQDDYCLDCYKALYPLGYYSCWEGDDLLEDNR